MTRARSILFSLLAAMALACAHPIDIVTPHAEVADLIVRDSSGALLGRTVENRRWDGSGLSSGVGRSARLVIALIDFQNAEIAYADRRDLEIRLEAEQPALVQWEPRREFGLLHGLAPGATRVRFLIWHVTHADFVTPWIALTITPSSQ